MNFTSRKPFRRTPNPVDDWLRNEGYFRKQTYNDATCLFRAVSEQIYMTQYYHFKVRRECVDFMKKNQNLFEKDVKIPFENYLKAMACATEWGGTREIRAMSLLYKREFVVYDGNKMTRNVVTNNGSDKFVNLCQTGHKKYESIFEREAISSAAFCQSIVYQTLYKGVFKIDGIDETVDKMLHDSSLNIRHDKFFLKGNVQSRDDLKVELINKLDNEEKKNADGNAIVESGGQDIPEIPYKVAKALDPNIYRNTELDVWHELTRGVRSAGWSRWNSSELQVGGKCYVMIEIGKENDAEKFEHKTKDSPAIEDKKEKNKDQKNSEESEKIEEITPIETKQMIGHIQEMGKNQGPVVVFIEELGKKMTVPFSSLTAIIPAKKTPWPTFNVVSVRKNYSYNSAYRWNSNNNSNNNNRKQWVSSNRRSKDTNRNYNGMDQLNNNEVNHNSNNMKKKENHENSSWNKKMNNPTSMMEKLTSIDNYSPKNSDKPIDVIEVRPVSVVFDNCQQNQESSSSLPTTGNPSPNDSSNGNNNSNSSSGNYTSGNNNSNDINTSGNGNSNSSNGISHSNSSGIPQNISTNSAQQNLTGSPNSNLTASTSMSVNCNSVSTNNSQNDIYDTSKSAGNKSETEAANIVTPTARSTPVPLQSNEIQLQVFNPHQIIQGNSGPQMLGPNTGIVYITPDGNIYPPYNYYGGFIPESAPIAAPSLLQPPSFSQDQLNRLNLSAQFSYDANGSDLPLSDLNTLRYFYNIGIDCHYRNAGGICQSSPGQYAYGTPGLVPRGNYFQMIPAAEYQPVQIQPQVVPQSQQFQQQIQQPPPQVQQSQQQVQQPQQQVQQTQQQTQQPQQQTQQPQQQVQQQIQQPQQQQQPTPSAQNVSPSQNNSVQRQNNQQNRRRNDQNSHSGRVNNNYYGTQKNLYPRKNDAHEMNYHRDEGQHSVYDQQKSKNNCGNLDANSGGNREQKQNVAGNNNNNNNNGRYRKNNDTRNRVFERPGSYQQDYQRKQASNYQGNPYNNRHGNEGGGGQALHRGKIPEACTPTQTVNSSPSVAPLASASAGSAAPIASNVTQFYQNYPPPPPPPAQTSSYTFENYCQQNQNYYPVPAIVAPHDIHEGNNPVSAPTPYYCPALDNNYQPMFQPYVLPPPPAIYQNAPTTPGPEHWYPVPGNQQPPPPFMSPGFAPIPVPQPLAPPTTMKPPTSN